jgi:hypothetical protein
MVGRIATLLLRLRVLRFRFLRMGMSGSASFEQIPNKQHPAFWLGRVQIPAP